MREGIKGDHLFLTRRGDGTRARQARVYVCVYDLASVGLSVLPPTCCIDPVCKAADLHQELGYTHHEHNIRIRRLFRDLK
jgi:hypothetical protein